MAFKTIKLLQLDSNPEPLNSQMKNQQFSQNGQMFKLISEYLSGRYIWLYIFVMSRTPLLEWIHTL